MKLSQILTVVKLYKWSHTGIAAWLDIDIFYFKKCTSINFYIFVFKFILIIKLMITDGQAVAIITLI